jgi:hypothetical protein
MKHSESIKEISQALLKAQREIIDPKQSAENPFFKSKYTPLVDILKIARPIYNKYGIIILQDVEGIKVSTIFLHESGEWIQQDYLELSSEKDTPQSGGSAITYARRYSISAWLSIASEEDDDGNRTQPKNNENKKPQKDSKQLAKEKYDKFYKSLDDSYQFELKDMSESERYNLFVKCNWDLKKLDEEIVKRADALKDNQEEMSF